MGLHLTVSDIKHADGQTHFPLMSSIYVSREVFQMYITSTHLRTHGLVNTFYDRCQNLSAFVTPHWNSTVGLRRLYALKWNKWSIFRQTRNKIIKHNVYTTPNIQVLLNHCVKRNFSNKSWCKITLMYLTEHEQFVSYETPQGAVLQINSRMAEAISIKCDVDHFYWNLVTRSIYVCSRVKITDTLHSCMHASAHAVLRE
jgi:hypothetical protein